MKSLSERRERAVCRSLRVGTIQARLSLAFSQRYSLYESFFPLLPARSTIAPSEVRLLLSHLAGRLLNDGVATTNPMRVPNEELKPTASPSSLVVQFILSAGGLTPVR